MAKIRIAPNRARQSLVNRIMFAGYHNDAEAGTRLYIEGRISFPKYCAAFREGRRRADTGLLCNCPECRKAKETSNIPGGGDK